jgi:hypothetical protein
MIAPPEPQSAVTGMANISVDLRELRVRDFLFKNTQTAAALVGYPEGRIPTNRWTGLEVNVEPQPQMYAPTIIRFYEDLVTELQREVARYKNMVIELTGQRGLEAEAEYAPGMSTSPSPSFARKLRSVAPSGLPTPGIEI